MTSKRIKVNRQLEEWLLKCKDANFPSNNGLLYKDQYTHISDYLAEHYHGEVERGAMIAAVKAGNCELAQIPYLNNHGKAHVRSVISRATELLQRSQCEISPYEGYLLLLAIQFHDLGNIFGRKDHEKKCREIMSTLGLMAGSDEPEKRVVVDIASAHGGLRPDGDKDVISRLEDEHDLMGQTVRARLLAAILRFADELADDSSRASTAMIELNQLPDESKIYHLYSLCLHSVMTEEDEIRLRFEIDASLATDAYIKNGNRVFLLDEIYERTLKMYTEMLYCMRFLRPPFKIDRIRVDVKIFPPDNILSDPLRITYDLKESGYPNFNKSIFAICSHLEQQTGILVKERISLEWSL